MKTILSEGFYYLLSHSAVGFAVKILAAIFSILMSISIARLLDPQGAGLIFLLISFSVVLSTLAKFGVDVVILRHTSITWARNDSACLSRKVKSAMILIAISTLVILLVVWGLRDVLSRIFFGGMKNVQLVILALLSVPPLALNSTISQAFLGIRKTVLSFFFSNLSIPMLFTLTLIPAGADKMYELAVLYVSVCYITCFVSLVLWAIVSPKSTISTVPNWSSLANLFFSAIPLLAVSISTQLILWAPQFMAGAWLGSEDVAAYSIAQRVGALVSFGLIVVTSVAGPKYATFYEEGKILEMRKLSNWSGRLLFLVSFPYFFLVFLFPGEILKLFGNDYSLATLPLRILLVGQFINVLTGSVGYMLSMSGYGKLLAYNTCSGAMLVLIAGFFLVPAYGVNGAALSGALGVLCQNVLGVMQVKKIHGFYTVTFWR